MFTSDRQLPLVFLKLYEMHFERNADSDIVSTYQLFSVQLMTDKKLEALDNA